MNDPIGVLVISHGTLADGLCSASKMIMGDADNLEALCFTEEMDPGEFGLLVCKTVTSFTSGCLVLCDLKGGTPFNQLILTTPIKAYKAVAGVNLNMLLEVLSERECSSIEELVQVAINAGTNGIVDVSDLIGKCFNNRK